MERSWIGKKDSFRVIDVRKATENFLPKLLKQAQEIEVGNGLCIVQTFDPKPLYSAMANLGFEVVTEQVSEREYRAYFYRTEKRELKFKGGADMPFKPTAVLKFKQVDSALASRVVDFWELIWDKEEAAIDLKTKLLLSMSNAIGAGRHRQATRELIKAYAMGTTVKELDELFTLFVWNQGIGYFSSEIGPSACFRAYQKIKRMEDQGVERKAILEQLMQTFGEQNPDVGV